MRSLLFAVSSFLIYLILAPCETAAQLTRADTAQVMYRVAQDLLAQGRDQDAEYLLDLIRQRYGETEAGRLAGAALQGTVAEREAQSGRGEVVAWGTIYGASLGVMIPAALGAESPEPFGLGLLLGGPAGFGLSKSWSSRHAVSSGQARAMTFGSWWGTWQGVGWQQVLDLGDRRRTQCAPDGTNCFTFEESSDEAPFTAMVLGGLGGLAVGTAMGRARPINASSALITNFSAMWGTWFGAVLGVLTDSESGNAFGDGEDHYILATTLIGGNVGLLAGAFGAPSLGWSTGDAWTVHLAGLAGLVAGFGLDLLMTLEDEEAVLAVPALTSALSLGIAAGAVSSDNRRSSAGQGGLQMSMLEVSNGEVNVGLPTPIPTMIPTWRGTERRFAPGARISLFRMGF